MFTVYDQAAGPHSKFQASLDHERLVLEARDVSFDWAALPMIRVAAQRGIDWRAVYAGRSREYMPFLDEVVSVGPDRVTVWVDDEHGGFAGVDDLLAGAGPTTAVYVCGPSAMLEAVRRARDEHANAPLNYERFSPPPVVDCVPFEVELARSRLLRDVQGESLCGTGRSSRPHRRGRRRNVGLRVPGARRPDRHRRLSR